MYWPDGEGDHTSILIPREDFHLPGPAPAAPDPVMTAGLPTDWVEVGFGSLLYYQATGAGKTMPFWWVFKKTPGAVQVLPFPLGGSPDEWRAGDLMLFAVDLPEAGYRALLSYVASSFALGPDGAPILVDDVHGSDVYRSSLTYSFRRFCNSWALQGLKVAGLPTDPWTPSQDAVKDWFRTEYRAPAQCRAQAGL